MRQINHIINIVILGIRKLCSPILICDHVININGLIQILVIYQESGIRDINQERKGIGMAFFVYYCNTIHKTKIGHDACMINVRKWDGCTSHPDLMSFTACHSYFSNHNLLLECCHRIG